MPEVQPSCSLIVVTWNSAAHLEGLVTTMLSHLDPASTELIVVDNDSGDDPERAAAAWTGPGRFIQLGHNAGFAAASNAGVAVAGAPTCVLLNPDTELVDDSLSRLAERASAADILAGPEVLNTDGSRQASASGPEAGIWPWIRALLPGALSPAAIARRTEPWRSPTDTGVCWLAGSCIAGRTETLRRLGPFDSVFHMYGEDTDLGLRADALGIRSRYCPQVATIVHHGQGSSRIAYGSTEGWREDGLINWRAAVRRSKGARAERWAWRALCLNITLRFAAKRLLRRECEREATIHASLAAVTKAPILRLDPPVVPDPPA